MISVNNYISLDGTIIYRVRNSALYAGKYVIDEYIYCDVSGFHIHISNFYRADLSFAEDLLALSDYEFYVRTKSKLGGGNV